MASASEFKKRMLSVGAGPLWTGSGHQLNWIIKNHFDNIRTVKTVDFVGYAIAHRAYMFENIAIANGKVIL